MKHPIKTAILSMVSLGAMTAIGIMPLHPSDVQNPIFVKDDQTLNTNTTIYLEPWTLYERRTIKSMSKEEYRQYMNAKRFNNTFQLQMLDFAEQYTVGITKKIGSKVVSHTKSIPFLGSYFEKKHAHSSKKQKRCWAPTSFRSPKIALSTESSK